MGRTGIKRHVILVGLPGAGKTTVGKLVAAALRAPFLDLDEAIERRAGKSIPQVFAGEGEDVFRALERAEMETALAGPVGVIAAGGGWAAQPGNLETAAAWGLTVYLRVAPEVAAGRVTLVAATGQRPADARPLLLGDDVTTRVRELYAARRAYYERCEAVVAAETPDPEPVALEVAQLARTLAGWY